MPIILSAESFPLPEAQVQALWEAAFTRCQRPDETVNVSAVSAEEMRTLNRDHRGKDKPTNVLTFSYGGWQEAIDNGEEEDEHDVVVCLEVAQAEAKARGMDYAHYVALLLAHAFLHVCGLDHELSAEEATRTEHLEEEILQACGYPKYHLA